MRNSLAQREKEEEVLQQIFQNSPGYSIDYIKGPYCQLVRNLLAQRKKKEEREKRRRSAAANFSEVGCVVK